MLDGGCPMKKAFLTFLLLVLPLSNLRGQQSGPPLTNDSIIKLVKAGLTEDTIVSIVKTQPGKYSLAADDIIGLRKAGVSEKVIAAMVNKSGHSRQSEGNKGASQGGSAKAGVAREGEVNIYSWPQGAQVSVDGEGIPGVTPLRIPLEVGKHTVDMVKPGYQPNAEQILVRPGETVNVEVTLREDQQAPAVAPKDSTYDFRKVRWGMTKEQVKAAESGKPKDDKEDILLYIIDLPGFDDVALVYHFKGNKLVRSNYGFLKEHTNKNDYIDDFKRVKKGMADRYGPSKDADDAIWKDALYKDDPDDWGMAVASGHLIYQAAWQTDRTDILVTLDGDNFQIHLGAQYTSRELGYLEKEGKVNPF